MTLEGITGKRVLITGATGGMGTALVALFAEQGARVGLHYHENETEAKRLLTETKKKSPEAEMFRANLTDLKDIQKLLAAFLKNFGGIDILINNAGAVYDYAHFSELDERSWQNTFDLNAKAPFYLSGGVFDAMKKQGGGRIINISSVNVKFGGSEKSMHYVASKAALESITRGFARAGAKNNILVNAIRCGVIDTPMRTNVAGYNEQDFQKRIAMVPLGRAGKPIDVAQMTLFLASEAGNFITGEMFTVAGGD